MADADPPDEINDVEAPAHGVGHPPDACSLKQQIGESLSQQHHTDEPDAKPDVPPLRRAMSQNERADLIRNGAEGVPWLKNGNLPGFGYKDLGILVHSKEA